MKMIKPCIHCGEKYENTRIWISELNSWICLACRRVISYTEGKDEK